MRVNKTRPALAASRHLGAELVLVRPPQHAGERQRCNDPAQSAVRVFHGCDLTAIQTTHRKSIPPSIPMNEAPRE